MNKLKLTVIFLGILFIINCGHSRRERYEFYDTDGNKVSMEEFQAKGRNGKKVTFYPDGSKKEEDLKGGIYHGTVMEWFPNGRLRGQGEFENGSGNFTGWYPNGTKREEIGLKNMKWHNRVRMWNEKGELIRDKTWEEGKLIKENKQ